MVNQALKGRTFQPKGLQWVLWKKDSLVERTCPSTWVQALFLAGSSLWLLSQTDILMCLYNITVAVINSVLPSEVLLQSDCAAVAVHTCMVVTGTVHHKSVCGMQIVCDPFCWYLYKQYASSVCILYSMCFMCRQTWHCPLFTTVHTVYVWLGVKLGYLPDIATYVCGYVRTVHCSFVCTGQQLKTEFRCFGVTVEPV